MIVAVCGQKGGVGKTTTSTNLSVIKSQHVNECLLVDASQQLAASKFAAARKNYSSHLLPVQVVQKFGEAIRADLLDLNEQYGEIIIDTDGYDSSEFRASLLVAAKAIFPLRPSQYDLWAFESDAIRVIMKAKEFNPKLEILVFFNQASTNYQDKQVDEAREFINDLSKHGELKLLNTCIRNRTVFRQSVTKGMAVTEYRPKDLKAIKEIKQLHEEIYNG